MVWTDALTQFLQLKEGLPMDSEGVCTNFISSIGLFKRYGSSIYGVTGTIGKKAIVDFLNDMYCTDTVVIPPYQHIQIMDNAHGNYLCKELAPIVLPDEVKWYQTIIDHALSHAQCQRSVLVICKYISEVKYLAKQLRSMYDAKKIFTYTGESSTFDKSRVDTGEIIIATIIAGRGTDFKTSDSVEFYGGMYVIVTFLPESNRVELQITGRTGRSGKRGMAQLIICDTERTSIDDLKNLRDQKEARATRKAFHDAQCMLLQDSLFSEFCSLESQYLPTVSECVRVKKWDDLSSVWNIYKADELSPNKITKRSNQWVANRMEKLVEQTTGSLSNVEASKLTATDRQNYFDKAAQKAESERKDFERKYKKDVLDRFCNAQSNIPRDLLSCLKKGQKFQPNSDLAKKYNWGFYERKGFEEDWGFWLKGKHFEDKDVVLDEVLSTFKHEFVAPVEQRALKDQLVRNPYFYVLKGNEYLIRDNLSSAIACYDRAIGMDDTFSVNARYNKAQALLLYEKNKGDRQCRAYEELKRAKEIIGSTYMPALLTFNTLITQHEVKFQTSQHVQKQLNLLNKQEYYIDMTCTGIEKAQAEDRHVKLTAKTVADTFNHSDQDHSKAIRKAAINGFTHLFTIEQVIPTPWCSIAGLALIGVTQLAAGCLITACSAGALGSALISEGISDMITVVKSAFQGGFDWGVWATQKAISLTVSFISYGIRAFKGAYNAVKSTFKYVISKRAVGVTKKGVQLATRELGSALAKGAIKECLTAACQLQANKVFIEGLEKKIREKVELSITNALLSNPLVLQAIELDVKNGNNCWQDLFIKEGLSLLEQQKKHICLTMLKEIGLGVAQNEISGFTQILEITKVANMMHQLAYYTDNFICKFNVKVQSLQSDITFAVQQISTSVSPTATHGTLLSDAPPIAVGEMDIVIDTVEEGTTYTSKVATNPNTLQKFYRGNAPSTPQSLIDAFKNQITEKLTDSVRSSLVNPAISYGVNALTSRMFRERDEATTELRNIIRTDAYSSRHCINEFELDKTKKEKEKVKANKKGNVKTLADEDNKSELNESVKKAVERLNNDEPLDTNDLALAVSVLGVPIYVYDKATGKLKTVLGDTLSGKPITLQHIKGDGFGHWEPLDINISVEQSGANSCLIDTVFAHLSLDQKEGIQDVNILKQKMIEELYNFPEAANKAYEMSDKLATIAQDQLRSG